MLPSYDPKSPKSFLFERQKSPHSFRKISKCNRSSGREVGNRLANEAGVMKYSIRLGGLENLGWKMAP